MQYCFLLWFKNPLSTKPIFKVVGNQQKMIKKLTWLLKRHPFLYRTRFKLLSKQVDENHLEDCSYNQLNPVEEIPDLFKEKNKEIVNANSRKSDLDIVKAISIWMQDNIKGGPGLSEASDVALNMMLNGEGGVCSDFAQIFNNFCVINKIKVREWGTTRIPFSVDFGGHSFNEVYIKELNKWVMVDVYYCLFFKSETSDYLSTLEFFKLQREGVSVTPYLFYANDRIEPNTFVRNYLKPGLLPFLICGYSNKRYDKLLRQTRSWLPIFASHFFMVLIGRSYHYRFALDNPKQLYK